MITISVERGLIRLSSWEELYETPGFVRALDPKSAQLKEIIGVYSFGTREPCGLGNCKQPHGNGYLATTTDGRVTNIGNICGKRNFSVIFTNLKKSFDKDLRAKERRERLETLQSRLPTIIERFQSLRDKASPLYKAVKTLTGSGVPQVIADTIRRMVRSGDGAITKSRKGTKQEREIALESGAARHDMPYYVTETVGRLSNLSAISASASIRSTFTELEPALNRLQECDVGTIPDTEARQLDKVMGGLDSRLDQIGQIISSLEALLTRQNIGQLASLLESPADKKLFSVLLGSLPST